VRRESWGHRSGVKRQKNVFLVVPLHFLPLKVQLVNLVRTFVTVSTVWSVSCLLFFYSRCPRVHPFVKVGGTCPRALWSRRHCLGPKLSQCCNSKRVWYSLVYRSSRLCGWIYGNGGESKKYRRNKEDGRILERGQDYGRLRKSYRLEHGYTDVLRNEFGFGLQFFFCRAVKALLSSLVLLLLFRVSVSLSGFADKCLLLIWSAEHWVSVIV